MKTILEFNLPDDDIEYRNAADGQKAIHLISDINTEIRSILKYWNETKSIEDYRVALGEMRSLIYEKFPDIDDR